MPKVSVVIPTYNRAHYVGRAVDSVLAQTFTDLEVIVVDDGSTDDTRQVLTTYLETHPDKVRYIYQENQERRVARNNGIQHSKGAYIAFLDSDDIWLPNKLEAQVGVLDRHQTVGLVYGQMFPIDPDGTWHFRKTKFTGWGEPGPACIFEKLVMTNLIPTPTVVTRRCCFERVGCFDPSLTCSEDWDLWLRVSLFYEIAFLPEPLAGATFYEDIAGRRDEYRSPGNRIKILERIFSSLPDHMSHLAHLKAPALARRYFEAACLDYALGRNEHAKDHFSRAISLDPSLVAQGKELVRALVDYGFYFGGASADSQYVLRFVETVLSDLPASAGGSPRLRRQAQAQVYMVDAFEGYELGDYSRVRQDVLKAVYYDPSLLQNRGMVSILLESVVGKRVMAWARASKARLSSSQGKATEVDGKRSIGAVPYSSEQSSQAMVLKESNE